MGRDADTEFFEILLFGALFSLFIMTDFPGKRQLLLFQSFNALSYWIILGTPIVLLTLWLGGGSRAVGIVSSVMPFLAILQIPSTRYITRLGYRRAMLAGWTSRTLMILGFVALPFFKDVWSANHLVLALVGILFTWSLLRGLANVSWFPWLRGLVPEQCRGRYFAAENIYVQLMSLIIFSLSGMIIGKEPNAIRFAIIYFVSFSAGMVSLYFLGRIPNVEIPPHEEAWGSILPAVKNVFRDKNFRRFLIFIIVWTLSSSGFDSFVVLFLKRESALPERMILWLGAISSGAMIAALLGAGKFLDRWGSKPVMKICISAILIYLCFWLMLAEGVFKPHLWLMICLFVYNGMVKATIWTATWRLLFMSVPHKNSLMSLAIFNTGVGIFGGATPLLWGFMIPKFPTDYFHPFGYYFMANMLLTLLAFVMLQKVKEKKAGRTRDVAIALLTLPMRSAMQLLSMLPLFQQEGKTQEEAVEEDPCEAASTKALKSDNCSDRS